MFEQPGIVLHALMTAMYNIYLPPFAACVSKTRCCICGNPAPVVVFTCDCVFAVMSAYVAVTSRALTHLLRQMITRMRRTVSWTI